MSGEVRGAGSECPGRPAASLPHIAEASCAGRGSRRGHPCRGQVSAVLAAQGVELGPGALRGRVRALAPAPFPRVRPAGAAPGRRRPAGTRPAVPGRRVSVASRSSRKRWVRYVAAGVRDLRLLASGRSSTDHRGRVGVRVGVGRGGPWGRVRTASPASGRPLFCIMTVISRPPSLTRRWIVPGVNQAPCPAPAVSPRSRRWSGSAREPRPAVTT